MNWKERYQIITPLNETFKGALFLACDTHTGQNVICRVLYHTNAEYYQTLQQITNSHFPRIYEVIRDQEDTVVIEEYISGKTLSAWLSQGTFFSIYDITSILSQLCEALTAIHSKGIIHRDIKPSNIILNKDRVVLIDFDAARKYHQNTQKDTIYMGTEGYAAPEQYGFAQTDSRSDIYSLGVVLRELCGEDRAHPLSPVIQRCTAFDPVNRYRSSEEILQDLTRLGLLPSQPISASQNPREWISGIPAENHTMSAPPSFSLSWKKIPKIFLTVFFIIETIIVLLRMPHEITVADYILSKLVYLPFVIAPAAICLNFFHIWQKAPLLRSPKIRYKILGVFLYILIVLIIIILFNTIAQTFYSPQSKQILNYIP